MSFLLSARWPVLFANSVWSAGPMAEKRMGEREWGGESQTIKIRVRRRLKGRIEIRGRKEGQDSLGQRKVSKAKMWLINDQALLLPPKKSEAN